MTEAQDLIPVQGLPRLGTRLSVAVHLLIIGVYATSSDAGWTRLPRGGT